MVLSSLVSGHCFPEVFGAFAAERLTSGFCSSISLHNVCAGIFKALYGVLITMNLALFWKNTRPVFKYWIIISDRCYSCATQKVSFIWKRELAVCCWFCHHWIYYRFLIASVNKGLAILFLVLILSRSTILPTLFCLHDNL